MDILCLLILHDEVLSRGFYPCDIKSPSVSYVSSVLRLLIATLESDAVERGESDRGRPWRPNTRGISHPSGRQGRRHRTAAGVRRIAHQDGRQRVRVASSAWIHCVVTALAGLEPAALPALNLQHLAVTYPTIGTTGVQHVTTRLCPKVCPLFLTGMRGGLMLSPVRSRNQFISMCAYLTYRRRYLLFRDDDLLAVVHDQ